MAWTPIKYHCGHEDSEQLYGPMRERERYKERMLNYDCTDCRVQKATAKHPDLPVLTGTQKQIAWACDIRSRVVAQAEAWLGRLSSGTDAEPRARLIRELLANTESRYWIDSWSRQPDVGAYVDGILRREEERCRGRSILYPSINNEDIRYRLLVQDGAEA